jgi:hypothetical protein
MTTAITKWPIPDYVEMKSAIVVVLKTELDPQDPPGQMTGILYNSIRNLLIPSSYSRSIGPIIKICQLNIEGISKDKCDYLAKLVKKTISGYILVDHLCSSIYGLATYVKTEIIGL